MLAVNLNKSDDKVTVIKGLTLNSEAAAGANTVAIQAALDKGGTILLPQALDTDIIWINDTLVIKPSISLRFKGNGKDGTQIKVASGLNLNAIISTENWLLVGGGSNDLYNNIELSDLHLNGNYFESSGDGTNPTINQLGSLANGIVLCGQGLICSSVKTVNVASNAFFSDTQNFDKSADLGEMTGACFFNCKAEKTGRSGFHMQDNALLGNIQGFLFNCEVESCNLLGANDIESGVGFFIASGRKWSLGFNRCYNKMTEGGFPDSQIGHGYYIIDAEDLNMVSNTCEDWGLLKINSKTHSAVSIEGAVSGKVMISGFEATTNEDINTNTLQVCSITTAAASDQEILVSNVSWKKRDGINPTLQGIYLNTDSGGTHRGTIYGCVCPKGYPDPIVFDGGSEAAGNGGLVVESNSWQLAAAPPSSGDFPRGYKVWSDVEGSPIQYWIQETGGAANFKEVNRKQNDFSIITLQLDKTIDFQTDGIVLTDGLTPWSFPVLSGKTYLIKAFLYIKPGGASSDFRWRLDSPAGTTGSYRGDSIEGGQTSGAEFTDAGTLFTPFVGSSDSLHVTGTAYVTTTGNIEFQLRNDSGTEVQELAKGSFIQIWEIA